MIKKIKPTATDEINIWPNPFDDIINIYSNQKEFDQLCVIDLNGRIIKQINLSKGLARIDLTHLKKGIYFAMLKSIDGRFKSTKIFKN